MARRNRRTRGSIDKLPSGKLRVRVYAGIDPLTRKPRYLHETVPGDDEDGAERALTRLLSQVDERRHPRSNITVSQAIAQWMEVADLADTTRERYEDLIRLYIEPTLGPMQAAKVDAELLERLYARLQRCRDQCAGRGRRGHSCRPLNPNTVRKIHFILRGAFDRAVRWRYLSQNEVALAEPPPKRSGEPDPPSAQEAARLLNEAWSDPEWGLLIWLAMVTGSRRGEICAVRWHHLDLDRGVVWIQASVAQTRAGLMEKGTKTHQKRRVSLDEYSLEQLALHRKRCESQCKLLGVALAEDAFVFSAAPDGSEPLLPRSVSQRYRRMAQRLGLRSTRFHSLRHYSATELIAAGVDVRTVAGRLGHGGGGSTTLRVYAAWVDEAHQQAAQRMADIVPRPQPVDRKPRGPYEEIAGKLRAAIVGGELAPGDLVPTVVDLANTHDVSVGTAHRALAVLKSEGLIDVRRGRRAVVVQPAGPAPGGGENQDDIDGDGRSARSASVG